jgi:hypothetical protein
MVFPELRVMDTAEHQKHGKACRITLIDRIAAVLKQRSGSAQ